MAIDSLNIWQDGWAALPKVNDDSWKANLGDYIESRIASLKLLSYVPNTNISFSFNKTLFVASLTGIDSGLGNGAVVIGEAFKTAILASTLALVVPISIGNPLPATTYSAVSSVIFDSASALLASSKIAELVNAPPVTEAKNSEFPVKLREAALLLTATISGTDTTTPTPLPLIDAFRSVI